MSLVNDVAVLFVMGYDEFTTGNFFCIIWYRRRDYENGVKAIESVPSLENVTVCFGMVIDEHFSSLVMRAEFYEEVKSIEIVNSLASEARLCYTLANLNAKLKNRCERNMIRLAGRTLEINLTSTFVMKATTMIIFDFGHR
ncbi:hypothetical protein Tco_1062298 [Tanacetum coccineum]